jgi:hypothetical protein
MRLLCAQVDFFGDENFRLNDGPLVMKNGLNGSVMEKMWSSDAFSESPVGAYFVFCVFVVSKWFLTFSCLGCMLCWSCL